MQPDSVQSASLLPIDIHGRPSGATLPSPATHAHPQPDLHLPGLLLFGEDTVATSPRANSRGDVHTHLAQRQIVHETTTLHPRIPRTATDPAQTQLPLHYIVQDSTGHRTAISEDEAQRMSTELNRLSHPGTPLTREETATSSLNSSFGSTFFDQPDPLSLPPEEHLQATPTPGSDEDLFLRYAQVEDQTAFNTLYERYHSSFFAYFNRRLNDPERSRDLTQETFLRMVRAKESFDASRSFSKWVHTITNNLLKNEYRARSRKRDTSFTELSINQPSEEGPHTRWDIPSTVRSPDGAAYDAEIQERLDRAIKQMDPRFREAFVEHAINDLPYDQVAATLKKAIGTVKSQAHRGRLQVRARLLELL